MNSRRVRRRQGDQDWTGAEQRKPWEGPTNQWGDDVNTRLGDLEVGQEAMKRDLAENNQMTREMYNVFIRSRRFGIYVLAAALWIGWNGLVTIWDWLSKHIK
jgi:hypothetical protein